MSINDTHTTLSLKLLESGLKLHLDGMRQIEDRVFTREVTLKEADAYLEAVKEAARKAMIELDRLRR